MAGDYQVHNMRRPTRVCQTALPHERVRSNSPSIVGDLMAVAYQTTEPGLVPAGMELFDIGAHFVGLDLEGFAYLTR